jgi:hypothetical protein
MYSKGGGKHGKHAAITDSQNLAALSNIVVQLFEPHSNGMLNPRPDSMLLGLFQFGLVPSKRFLCLLHDTPHATTSNGRSNEGLHLSPADWTLFRSLQSGSSQLKTAFINFNKRLREQARRDSPDESN